MGFIYRQGAGLDCGEFVVMSLLAPQQPPVEPGVPGEPAGEPFPPIEAAS